MYMNSARVEYWTPDHPDAHMDMVIQPRPKWASQKCLKCHGYGQWILMPNEYPTWAGYLKHFRAYCENCEGYGWTRPENHIHEWVPGRVVHKNTTEYTCKVCGLTRQVDSGD